MGEQVNIGHTPLVSVIMPAYNTERFIEASIRSVMAQTFQDWELIILDDRGPDNTMAVAERLAAQEPRIRLVQNEENMGVARTRDRGIDLCRGEYIAFLDSDDIWYPEKLERQLALLQERKADLAYSSYAIIDARGEKTRGDYLVPPAVTYEDHLKENRIGCLTVLVKAELARKYRFDTGFYHEDYVLWARILRDGYKAAGCTELLASWRYVEDSRSFNKYKAARNRWRIYRGYLKLPILKCIWVFSNYALGGMKKYMNVYEE